MAIFFLFMYKTFDVSYKIQKNLYFNWMFKSCDDFISKQDKKKHLLKMIIVNLHIMSNGISRYYEDMQVPFNR